MFPWWYPWLFFMMISMIFAWEISIMILMMIFMLIFLNISEKISMMNSIINLMMNSMMNSVTNSVTNLMMISMTNSTGWVFWLVPPRKVLSMELVPPNREKWLSLPKLAKKPTEKVKVQVRVCQTFTFCWNLAEHF